jgi:hypothetical protein
MASYTAGTTDADFFFLFFSIGAWTQGVHLQPLHQPYVFCEEFLKMESHKLFPGLALSCNPPDLCLLSS